LQDKLSQILDFGEGIFRVIAKSDDEFDFGVVYALPTVPSESRCTRSAVIDNSDAGETRE
jgi:hypothetical protein